MNVTSLTNRKCRECNYSLTNVILLLLVVFVLVLVNGVFNISYDAFLKYL